MKSKPTNAVRSKISPSPATAAEPGPPRGCTNYKLRQFLRAVSRLYDAELAQAGLKTTQFSLLSNLAGSGPIRPSELAAQMNMDASTMTRNLRVLVDEGWVEVGNGPDARSRWVTLTPSGRDRLVLAKRHWKQAQLKLNSRLSESRVAHLHQMIDEGLERLGATS